MYKACHNCVFLKKKSDFVLKPKDLVAGIWACVYTAELLSAIM